MSAGVRLGTAGWTIPRAHAERVPPGDSALYRYAQLFDAVEVNSSFWKRHQPKTWTRWAATVPDGFLFAVKLPRALTHVAGLSASRSVLDDFFADVAGLGDKLGPLLLQLPPSLAFEQRKAAAFFRALRARHALDVACEPRHATWFEPAAEELLASFGVARVAADPPRAPTGGAPGGSPALAYYRLHGSPDTYRTPYGERCESIATALRVQAEGRGAGVLRMAGKGAAGEGAAGKGAAGEGAVGKRTAGEGAAEALRTARKSAAGEGGAAGERAARALRTAGENAVASARHPGPPRVFCFFDNTASGAALGDALRVQELLRGGSKHG